MNYCPITLEPVSDGERYSREGLRSLHPRLTDLKLLGLTHEEQLQEARRRADKMSIQGVQPKLSAILKPGDQRFEIVDQGGRFLLKPNPPQFEEVPANEALTMTMAEAVGIEIPPHGLLGAEDGGWVYVIRRFDREGRNTRLHVEDFAQLSGATRETKYGSSLEKVARVVEELCTFPAIELPKLATRLLFCFVTGNEDMHLKNFSLIVRNKVVMLSPAYDLLNTSLVLDNPKEESALPLGGKKSGMTRKLWLDYFMGERLGMTQRQINDILDPLAMAYETWTTQIKHSFLSTERKADYQALLDGRMQRLGLIP